MSPLALVMELNSDPEFSYWSSVRRWGTVPCSRFVPLEVASVAATMCDSALLAGRIEGLASLLSLLVWDVECISVKYRWLQASCLSLLV